VGHTCTRIRSEILSESHKALFGGGLILLPIRAHRIQNLGSAMSELCTR